MTARTGERRGWAWRPALASDLDPVVIDRLCGGDRVTASVYERREAVRRLRLHGYTYRQISARLRIGERMVDRDLRVLGLQTRCNAAVRAKSAADRQVSARLLTAGALPCEVAVLLGVHRNTVKSWRRRLGLPAMPPGRPCGRQCRPRPELLVLFGHLLPDAGRVAS